MEHIELIFSLKPEILFDSICSIRIRSRNWDIAAYFELQFILSDKKGIKADIYFNTATPAIFGVPKYANELMKLVAQRNINLSTGSNLTAVDHNASTALFSDGQELKLNGF